MIGSFWNLCRACPSMPIDKQLHSEYRSTYTWHEYTGPQQEHTVVRHAPQPPLTSTKQANAKLQSAKSTEDESSEGPTLEPPLPRRKKCPELAYKTHEFITAADGGGIDAVDSNLVADKIQEASTVAPNQLSKAISRISTEYRLQFAWPKRAHLTNGDAGAPVVSAGVPVSTAGPPRKSLSMGALKQSIVPTGPAPVHKKRPGDLDHKRDGAQASELEPLVSGIGNDAIDGTVPEMDEREEDLTDIKMTFRSRKSGSDKTVRITEKEDRGTSKWQEKAFPTAEVIELRRLADEYKHRDWASGLSTEEEASLWKGVSSNHALNALSLARSVTKEEKNKENTKKITPAVAPTTATTMVQPAGRPSSVQAKPIHAALQDDLKMDTEKTVARARKDFLIRHHLDRTTGVGDGALLPSPTREKLEPVIPRRREETKEHREEIQPRNKSSPKNSPRTGRSQSLGPSMAERRSPKRQPPRAASVTKDVKEKEREKEPKEKEKEKKVGDVDKHGQTSATEPKMNGDVTGGDSSVASTPPSQARTVSGTATAWIDDEPVVKSPPEPTRVKSPEQMIMRSPEPVNWTVPLDTGKTFTVTQNVREEPLTRPQSEAKTWAPACVPSAPQSAPPELAGQHKPQQHHSQYSGYKSPESESLSLGSFAAANDQKEFATDSERASPCSLPAHAYNATATPTQSDKKSFDMAEGEEKEEMWSVKIPNDTNTKYGETEITTQIPPPPPPPPPACQPYRVLEAESSTVGMLSEMPSEGESGGGGFSGYHVLEAPPVQIVPGTAHRSSASDVLEKARNRFDKFWGKGSPPEN